jgi:hypothetical protein
VVLSWAAHGLTVAQTSPRVLQISVTPAAGPSAADLDADDFVVSVGGVPRPVVRVVRPGPLSVLFVGVVSESVVDRTRTQGPTWIDLISSAADDFVRALQPSDRARLMTVGGSQFEAGVSDRATLAHAARRIVPEGAPQHGSPIWDAVDLALPLFANEPGRKATVLVTDGRASANRADVDEVAGRAAAAGVAVSVVELEATPRTFEMTGSPDIPRPGPFLRTLAAITGGSHLVARVNQAMSVHDPGPLVAAALHEQRSTLSADARLVVWSRGDWAGDGAPATRWSDRASSPARPALTGGPASDGPAELRHA